MATNSYILTITSKGSDARFVISYRAGKFYRLERKSGKLINEKQWKGLFHVVPEQESDIEKFRLQFKEKDIDYSIVNKQAQRSLFVQFNEAFFDFYTSATGMEYNYTGVDGKSIKSIITSLRKLCADDYETVALWQTILSSWHKLEEFYRKQMEPRQIRSNLNTILRQIKYGHQPVDKERREANNYANDLRESIKS